MKQTKFTNQLREELCGKTFWCPGVIAINVVDVVEHDWDSNKDPSLKKVWEETLRAAYDRGFEAGKEEIRCKLKEAIGHID